MKAKSLSIRLRLLWHMAFVFVIGMVALYIAASSYAEFAADSSYDRLLAGSAASIVETLSITQEGVRADIPYVALDMLSAAPNDRVFYRVIGPDGASVTGYANLPIDDVSQLSQPDDENMRFFDADYNNETVRFVMIGREIRVKGKTSWVWVQVGQTNGARMALAKDLTIGALFPIVLLTMTAIAVVWFSVGKAVQPLEAIGRSLSSRDSSDLSPIDDKIVPVEIAPLVLSMNQFMGRLDNNINILRDFIANAAHQLRTPITALLVQIRSAESTTGEPQKTSVTAASQSASRLARLVDQLLSDALVSHRAEDPVSPVSTNGTDLML